jgi:hypothetical protein
LFEGSNECILSEIFCETDIAHNPHETGHEPR